MSLKLIGLCGHKMAGKTTVAGMLAEYGYARRAFADPLKAACKIMFQLTDEQLYGLNAKEIQDVRWGLSPRQILQRLGTDVCREIDPDVWIKNFKYAYNSSPGQVIVVDDVRFPNEADAIRELGGAVIGIRRPGVTPDIDEPLHQSERTMLMEWDTMCDITIVNDGDLKKLRNDLDVSLITLEK